MGAVLPPAAVAADVRSKEQPYQSTMKIVLSFTAAAHR
jgi:hypothetical protein